MCQTSYSLLSCGLLLSLPLLIAPLGAPILAQTPQERHDIFRRLHQQSLQLGAGQREVVSAAGRKQLEDRSARIADEAPIISRHKAHRRSAGSVGAGLAGYLLADSTDSQLNLTNAVDASLSGILDRIGPDMRPLRDFNHASADITLEVAQRAWLLMRHHAQTAALDKLSYSRPFVEEALESAKVSPECLLAARETMEAGEQLQSWAIQCKYWRTTATSVCVLAFPMRQTVSNDICRFPFTCHTAQSRISRPL